jgi:ribosome-binding protein aMBF1 (putative translation factor)
MQVSALFKSRLVRLFYLACGEILTDYATRRPIFPIASAKVSTARWEVFTRKISADVYAHKNPRSTQRYATQTDFRNAVKLHRLKAGLSQEAFADHSKTRAAI